MSTQENPGSDDRAPQDKSSSLTSVKTVYARAAIILLALNFGFTGYLTYNMNQVQTELVESMQGAADTKIAGAAATLSASKESPQPAVSTRDKTEPLTPNE